MKALQSINTSALGNTRTRLFQIKEARDKKFYIETLSDEFLVGRHMALRMSTGKFSIILTTVNVVNKK